MIRNTIAADSDALMTIIGSSGQFDTDSLDFVKRTLINYLDGQSDDIWLTADDGEPVGVAYCAPEAVTIGTWNMLMLWTREDKSGQGHGSALVTQLEKELANRGARLLIVETSGLPEFASARVFYQKCGFFQEGKIRNFFAERDDKIIYSKPLQAAGKAG